ncbi:hypothetical protein [Pseudooceanicola sp.]|uniref:hypothetical protein n=1 Tax=Pseudooceanicola sp. TaxID=1914328 RepID=UPI00261F222C|nr:hypothetical protein [Pseudooceanicola sp.]MDF1855703.1 hypothetical protein [Pseudooceanicola sp.]
MALWKTTILIAIRLVMGRSIIGVFGTMIGVGTARQAVPGGTDLGDEAQSTLGLRLTRSKFGVPLLALAGSAASSDRRRSHHWASQ